MKVNLEYLRKEKAEEMFGIYRQGIRQYDDLKVEKYEDATILPAKGFAKLSNDTYTIGLGGVLDSSGSYIELSKNCAFFGGKYKTEREIRKSEKTVVYCGYFQYHWGHFLVDTVPRLWWALEEDENVDEYAVLGKEGGDYLLQGNILEFFRLLGISDKVKIITEPTKYKRVVIPQPSYNYGDFFSKNTSENYFARKYYSKKYLQTFDYIVERALEFYDEKEKEPHKIFLTRSCLEERKEMECGAEMVDSFFVNNGYYIIAPERLPLKKMIYFMNHCVEFASVSGTASHNLLFATSIKNVLIIERQPFINHRQNDIIIMREMSATFIDANYSIFPINFNIGPFIYAYRPYLQNYIRDMKFDFPDYQYTTEEYRNRIVKQYLKNYCVPQISLEGLDYMVSASNESIRELYPDFQFIPYKTVSDYDNKYEIKRRIIKYLLDNNLVYKEWEYIDLYTEFVKAVEKGIEQGKTEFLIYPFGRNGMFLKQILNEQYGIKEKMIFDNKLCKYNSQISPIREAASFINDRTTFIVTSNRSDCWRELLKYCDFNIIEGPFSF